MKQSAQLFSNSEEQLQREQFLKRNIPGTKEIVVLQKNPIEIEQLQTVKEIVREEIEIAIKEKRL